MAKTNPAKKTTPKKLTGPPDAGKAPDIQVPTVMNLTIMRNVLRSQDITQWRNAINAARDIYLPMRRLLHELYENIALDGHLQSVMMKRTVGVTNKNIVFSNTGAGEGVINEAVMESVVETPWFHEFLEGCMSAIYYGTTVLELVPEGGEIKCVEVIPRANVVPERNMILRSVFDFTDGVNYKDDAQLKPWLIQVGRTKDYGAMMVAAQYVIYKRGGFGDWAQYAELFGMPLKKGTYNPYDDTSRVKLEEALKNMGGAPWVVIPEGADVEFITANGGVGAGDVYDKMIERCDAEMSKLILGQTLTTTSGDKGARSLGEVHKQSEEEITRSDMRRMEFLLNSELLPRLEQFGYPVTGGEFHFNENGATNAIGGCCPEGNVCDRSEELPVAMLATYTTHSLVSNTCDRETHACHKRCAA